MLYKKNSEKQLSDELFQNPTSEYRAAPFWAWNGHPEPEQLSEQIKIFRSMGFGGFHMHVRSGMDVEYLSPEFFANIRHCVNEAECQNMLAWLYDEDRWPSGAVGGKLTKDISKRQKYLLWTKTAYCGKTHKKAQTGSGSHFAERTENGTLLACYDVSLHDDGTIKSYKRIAETEEALGTKWYAYVETPSANPWYNGQTYADILDPTITREFVEMTHAAYKREVGDKFDSVIPSIFTDEPQMAHKRCLSSALEGDDAAMPWTTDMVEDFAASEGADLLEKLPEAFFDLPGEEPSEFRWKFHNYLAERFAKGFADVCGKWCEENNLPLTGHVMREPTLDSQTESTGETMRSYRSFTIPGIDMLASQYEYTTAKQCQSAVRQYGRIGMTSELYGVNGLNCDFGDYKRQGDWQAALGVTIRVPHLSFYTMKGQAKRDYPASFSYQSPWFDRYSMVEDHFARVATALSRGKTTARVAVVHPVESYWLAFGPKGESAARKEWLEKSFLSLTEWLIFGGVDFDFISEALLPDLCKKGSAPLQVGEMQYDAVIVPPLLTLKDSTVERLTDFALDGCDLIFTCEKPPYCNAKPSDAIAKAYEAARKIDFDRQTVLEALDRYLPFTILEDGKPNDTLLSNLRRDNDCNWLFLAQGRRKRFKGGKSYWITLRGDYEVEEYDTATGEHRPLSVAYANGTTQLLRVMHDCDSLLVRLTERKKTRISLPEEYSFKLSEENVLLLDAAEYAVDGGEFAPRTELLRANNVCRVSLGMQPHKLGIVQPWALEREEIVHTVTTRFRILSEIEVDRAHLALELDAQTKILCNGEQVAVEPDGWYTDRSISTVRLPKLVVGENVLEITQGLGESTCMEWCYLLGSFGVKVEGDTAKIIKAPEKLTCTDLASQGYPFYGGLVSYEAEITVGGGSLSIAIPSFGGTFARVLIDGEAQGIAAYPPHTLTLDGIPAGKHSLTVEVCIPRANAFGPVHNAKGSGMAAGPAAWRSEGEKWSDDYRLTVQGLTSAPILEEL